MRRTKKGGTRVIGPCSPPWAYAHNNGKALPKNGARRSRDRMQAAAARGSVVAKRRLRQLAVERERRREAAAFREDRAAEASSS